MAERMVLVPVSLIERLMMAASGFGVRDEEAVALAYAVKSEHAPLIPADTPPRIEDMGPGTTFSRDDYPDEVWTVKRDICDGGIYALSDGHRSQNVEDIDPSTIRDVRPPKDAV